MMKHVHPEKGVIIEAMPFGAKKERRNRRREEGYDEVYKDFHD